MTENALERRLVIARRQLRKAGQEIDHAAGLPTSTLRTLKTLAEDCAIQTSTILKRLETIQPLTP